MKGKIKTTTRFKKLPYATEEVKLELLSFLTSAPDSGKLAASRPCRFISGKETRYPLNRRLGGPQGRSGWFRKDVNLSPLSGLKTVSGISP
jgi:hypothetical protein